MEDFYKGALEVAKGIEEMYLNSNRSANALIDEGKELIGKGIEGHE